MPCVGQRCVEDTKGFELSRLLDFDYESTTTDPETTERSRPVPANRKQEYEGEHWANTERGRGHAGLEEKWAEDRRRDKARNGTSLLRASEYAPAEP